MNSPCFESTKSDKNFRRSGIIKRKKKRVHGKSAMIKAYMDCCTDPSLQSLEEGEPPISGLCSSTFIEQRNLGSPIIVDAISDNLSPLNLPEMLRDSKPLENKYSDKDVSYKRDAIRERGNAEIIVARTMLPNASPCNAIHEVKVKESSEKNTLKKRDHNETLKSENFNIPTTSFFVYNETPRENHNIMEAGGATPISKKDKWIKWTNDQNAPRLYSLKNKVVVVMEKMTKFCFTGKLIVQVIYGGVEVYGSVIIRGDGPTEVYSPRGYSSVAIKTTDEYFPNDETDIWELLSAQGFSREIKNSLSRDIDRIQPGMAVILLSNLENQLTKYLNTFYPFRLFPKILNQDYSSWTGPGRAEIILQSNLYYGNFSCKELISDRKMIKEVSEKILNRWRAKQWSCALIAGGKNVGKSTNARFLINKILPFSKKVVLVDLDLGQTECTPSGCISYTLIEEPLMGPNFTHLMTPVNQFYIGDVNVARCISRYVKGIKLLVDKLKSCPELSSLPIIVNTMGFTYGIGLDIIIFTIKLIRPSLVVQIISKNPKNNYSGYLSKEIINEQRIALSANLIDCTLPCDHELLITRSIAESKMVPSNENWNMKPYQQRELVMISYLGGIVRCLDDTVPSSNTSSPGINEVVPYVTPFSSVVISILRSCVPPSHALNVLNGNIVALCGIDLATDKLQASDATAGPRVLNRLPLCVCYGFGIVRGVDMEKEEIFLNTSLPSSVMQYVNCLAECAPTPITLLQPNHQRNVPYTGGSSEVQPTSREPRRGYFRMRYQKALNKP